MSTNTTPPAFTTPPYSSPLATGTIVSPKATATSPSTINGANTTSILQGPYPTVSSAYCGSMPVAELTGYNNPSQCGYINSGPQFGDLVQNGVILNDTFNFNTTGPSFPIELSWTCNNFACSYPVSLRSFHCEDGCDGIHDVVDGLAASLTTNAFQYDFTNDFVLSGQTPGYTIYFSLVDKNGYSIKSPSLKVALGSPSSSQTASLAASSSASALPSVNPSASFTVPSQNPYSETSTPNSIHILSPAQEAGISIGVAIAITVAVLGTVLLRWRRLKVQRQQNLDRRKVYGYEKPELPEQNVPVWRRWLWNNLKRPPPVEVPVDGHAQRFELQGTIPAPVELPTGGEVYGRQTFNILRR